MRTNNNGETITFSVNEGYEIVGLTIEGYSNNASTTADRSIIMTGAYIDGSEQSVLDANVVFPGGTAGQNPVTKEISGFEAKQSIKLAFDNSNITTSDVDSKGKNKQILANVTFKYKKIATGIESAATTTVAVKNGRMYNLNGQPIGNAAKNSVYVVDGKKYVKK